MADNDSHLSTGKDTADSNAAPLPQRHRNKLGENVTGQTNPNGAAVGPTDNKLANQGGKRW